MAGIVFTGAPGSGKSTTIERFEVDGQTVVKEVARELIDYGLSPWDNFDLFHETLLEIQLEREITVSAQSVYLVDRGLHDIKAYYMLAGRSIPIHFQSAFDSVSYRQAFLFEMIPEEQTGHWESTFTKSDRRELQRLMHRIYSDIDVHVTVVPFAPFSRRIEWLRNRL